jgi:hypothetical protein
MCIGITFCIFCFQSSTDIYQQAGYKFEVADSIPGAIDVARLAAHAELPTDERRQRWFELSLVLLLACAGAIMRCMFCMTARRLLSARPVCDGRTA